MMKTNLKKLGVIVVIQNVMVIVEYFVVDVLTSVEEGAVATISKKHLANYEIKYKKEKCT